MSHCTLEVLSASSPVVSDRHHYRLLRSVKCKTIWTQYYFFSLGKAGAFCLSFSANNL